jgi:hypothetical protein
MRSLCPVQRYGTAMGILEASMQYVEFSEYVVHGARHILDEKNRQFVETIVKMGRMRTETVAEGTFLYRAQIGHEWRDTKRDGDDGQVVECTVRCPHKSERMTPFADRATEGRVNAKGIPCLYTATDTKTAIYEVRPWTGSYVSVAAFLTHRELKLVDCSKRRLRGGRQFATQEEHLWQRVNRAFSEPVSRTDDVAEYSPTQVLAEAFRHDGCDGIKYSSSRKGGVNIALFSLNTASATVIKLYRVQEMELLYCAVTEYECD